jgi:NADH-quinone oxidoreductase subunit N
MQNIINLNSSIPEIFLSISILGQLLFGAYLAYNKHYKYSAVLKEISVHTNITVFFLVMIYLFEEASIQNSIGLYKDGVLFSKIATVMFGMYLLVFLSYALKTQKIIHFEYYFFYLVALLSLLLMLNVNDLLMFYLTMEAQTLCFYVLASANRTSIFSVEAALKYFIAGSFFSASFLAGTALLYGCLGTINLEEIYALLSFGLGNYSTEIETLVFLAIVLITSTLLFKIASAPFHFWMPDVYEGAPISSTMVFSILPKFPLIFFFIKWLNSLGELQFYIKDSLVFFGVISTLIGTLYALKQLKVKRMILYSSIAQVGFIVAAIGLETNEGLSSVFFFTIIYIITSILVWGNIILINSSTTDVSLTDSSVVDPLYISNFSNVISYNFFWKVIFSVIFFSIAGIPPFVGFTSKFLVLKALVLDNYLISSTLLLVISSVSVFYYIRILKISFFETHYTQVIYDESSDSVIKKGSDELFLPHFVIILLTSSLILLFFYPNIVITFVNSIVLSSFLI